MQPETLSKLKSSNCSISSIRELLSTSTGMGIKFALLTADAVANIVCAGTKTLEFWGKSRNLNIISIASVALPTATQFLIPVKSSIFFSNSSTYGPPIR